MTEIRIPAMGESVTTGIIAEWLKQDGEAVALDEELMDLETDKATLAVPSPGSGVLKILVPEGEEVAIGQVVGELHEEGTEALPPEKSELPAKKEDAVLRNEGPAARTALAEHNLTSEQIKGSGKDGRVTRADVLAHVQTPKADVSQTEEPVPGERRVAMSRIRKKIAENLVSSQAESAHLTTFNEIDMSEVMELRGRYKDSFQKQYDVKLGFMSFFVKAAAFALGQYPNINAVIDGNDIIYRDHLNIGIAVSTEKGLITPVLRNAAELSFAHIEKQIISFARRASEKKLKPDELFGGTFTITNGGIFGSMLSTPIPSPGQSAILGMHSIKKRAVVVQDEIVVRPVMYVALTYDHRIVDGREAVGFLNVVRQCMEDPGRMLLEVF